MRIAVKNYHQFMTKRRGTINLPASLACDATFTSLGTLARYLLLTLYWQHSEAGAWIPEPYDTESYRELCSAGLIEQEPEKTQKSFDDRKASRYISDAVRLEVFTRDNGRCKRCGRQDMLEYDHLVPYSQGGSSEAENIELLCRRCNRRKSNKNKGSLR